MPFYNCKYVDEFGYKKSKIVESNDELTLKANFRKNKCTLTKYILIKEKEPNTFFAVRSTVKRSEVIMFLRQFAVMVKSSVTISEAINVLRGQKYSKAFKKVLLTVHQDLLSGLLLSEAFRKHPKVFPSFFVNMVEIGEASSSLDTVLESMADYYENDAKIKRKTKSAMAYPTILFILTMVVGAFITLFIVPQFEETINELGGDVPTITKVVMGISLFMKNNILYILLGLIIFVGAIILFLKTKKGKYTFDYIKIHFPIIKNIQINVITSRFSKAFVILLNSGMTMVDCLTNLDRMLENTVFVEKFKYSIDEVKRGRQIATSIEAIHLFPTVLVEMIRVGEKSGNIEEVLTSTSNYFDDVVDQSVSKATASLEPIMIILLGVVVGIVILAVLLPIISLMNSI